MKKYLIGAFAVVLSVSLAAFTPKEKIPSDESSTTTYDWYAVDYSIVPTGIIPANATVVLPGKTVNEATAADGCPDVTSRDCLRGFIGTPPPFPTDESDESTPRP